MWHRCDRTDYETAKTVSDALTKVRFNQTVPSVGGDGTHGLGTLGGEDSHGRAVGPGLAQVRTVDDVWAWLEGPVMDAVAPLAMYNGVEISCATTHTPAST